MGFLSKNDDSTPAIHIFWGEYFYSGIPHFNTSWDASISGSGIGKINYDLVKGVDATSDQCLIILERTPEYSIEKWSLESGTPVFTGIYASGHGDENSKFNNPVDVTTDNDNYVYVLDMLSTGQPKIKVFDANLQSIGGVGNITSIPGTPIAIDWDRLGNAAHVLHSSGVAVFYK